MNGSAPERISVSTSREIARVAVLATDRRTRIRIVGELTGQPGLWVEAPEDHGLLSTEHDVIVLHCETVRSEHLALIADLKTRCPEAVTIVVCDSSNGRGARRAVDAGVDGFVFGEQLSATLAPTVAAVLAGQTVVPRALRASARRPSLSFREKQILGMVVMGFTNNEIGARLFLAESTVKSHLSSAFGKLGVRSRSEAAAMILDPQGTLGPGILAITGDSLSLRAK